MDAKERIKYFLKEKNISEYKLAKLSGLSQSTISNIFIRNTSPTIPTVEAICKGLDISLAQFFSEENEECVYLSDEQKQLFDSWIILTKEQKSVIFQLIDSYKEK
ncbi:MAG: helix-turn-helix transcriptional regulator [Oscillospiraceae bacterium]|nr:helix-turn-helix transcriptional regulator [Oscillospiraceae bacterium]